ncbi:MAG: STAS domain-containing protein [Actinomycetota bacterium]
MTPFEISTTSEDGVVELALKGELDIASFTVMEDRLREVEAESPKVVVFDLRGLRFMDSTGLRVIISADKRARRDGWRVAVVEGPEAVHRVFRLALLDRRLDFVSDPAEVRGDGS